MSFKDEARKDIQRVFVNPLEFAEPHDIDGTTVLCVVDDDVIDERQGIGRTQWMDGVYIDMRLIYIEKDLLPRKPVRGQLMRLDGERFIVQKVAENMGVLEITIEANES